MVSAIVTQGLLVSFLVVILDFELFLQAGLLAMITLPIFVGIFMSPDITKLSHTAEDWKTHARILLDIGLGSWFVICGLLIKAFPLVSTPFSDILILIGSGCLLYFAAAFAITRRGFESKSSS